MQEVVLVLGGFWFGLVIGVITGYTLRPTSVFAQWRESADYRRHVGEPYDVNERT